MNYEDACGGVKLRLEATTRRLLAMRCTSFTKVDDKFRTTQVIFPKWFKLRKPSGRISAPLNDFVNGSISEDKSYDITSQQIKNYTLCIYTRSFAQLPNWNFFFLFSLFPSKNNEFYEIFCAAVNLSFLKQSGTAAPRRDILSLIPCAFENGPRFRRTASAAVKGWVFASPSYCA